MTVCPFATYRQVTAPNRAAGNAGARRMEGYHRINLHTAVVDAIDMYGGANNAERGVFPHFYLGPAGELFQYQDLDFQATSDLDGNPDTISIESWDGYGRLWKQGDPVPPWNDKQLATAIRLIVWLWDQYPTIPRKLATSNLRGEASWGLSWHRLGIPGYSQYTAATGGLMYSTSYKKECPGAAKIAQIPGIYALALTGETQPWDGTSFPGSEAFVIGQAHPAVVVLGERLLVHGFGDHHDGDGYQPGPTFSIYDRDNVRDFQLAQGWTGTGADGYPGPKTWAALMAEPETELPPPVIPPLEELPVDPAPATTPEWAHLLLAAIAENTATMERLIDSVTAEDQPEGDEEPIEIAIDPLVIKGATAAALAEFFATATLTTTIGVQQ